MGCVLIDEQWVELVAESVRLSLYASRDMVATWCLERDKVKPPGWDELVARIETEQSRIRILEAALEKLNREFPAKPLPAPAPQPAPVSAPVVVPLAVARRRGRPKKIQPVITPAIQSQYLLYPDRLPEPPLERAMSDYSQLTRDVIRSRSRRRVVARLRELEKSLDRAVLAAEARPKGPVRDTWEQTADAFRNELRFIEQWLDQSQGGEAK
jgi:hypothetical protein